MMKFKITVEAITEVETLTQQQIRGTDMTKVAELTGAEIHKDWQEKEYINIMVPGHKTSSTTVFIQTVEDLDLSKLVMTVNSLK